MKRKHPGVPFVGLTDKQVAALTLGTMLRRDDGVLGRVVARDPDGSSLIVEIALDSRRRTRVDRLRVSKWFGGGSHPSRWTISAVQVGSNRAHRCQELVKPSKRQCMRRADHDGPHLLELDDDCAGVPGSLWILVKKGSHS